MDLTAKNNISYFGFVVDNLDGPCYISDINTYELLFMNKKLLNLLGGDHTRFKGKKCYEVLQNKTSPCSFCTNHYLEEEQYYCWEHYNEYLKRYYDIKDTLIIHEGRHLRLEITTDITSQKEKCFDLEAQVSVEQMLVECASTLCKGDEINIAIDEILSIIGKYYKANRAYLFEIDSEAQYINNTNEWCAEGVEPQLDSLQKVPLSIIEDWMIKFSTIGAYSIDSLDADLDTNSADYKILEMQDIKSLLTVPLTHQGEIVGFIGVDDPTVNRKDLQTLQTVAMFILDDLNKIKMAQRMEYLNNRDELTGTYNRNCYSRSLNKIKQSTLNSVGIIYVDINGLRAINNVYGYQFGDNYIASCAQLLKEYFEDNIYRIGANEFLIFLKNVDYLDFDKKVTILKSILQKRKQVSMAIGTSWCNDIQDIDKYIVSADEAMLKDKEKHSEGIDACVSFFKDSSEKILLKEINQNLFEILLQPKLFLDTGKVIGAEALVRKKDEFGNYIPPDLFIPRYETQGNVFLIDIFVLREVCQFIAQARYKGVNQIPHISLNFSRITLLVPDIHKKAKEICDEYDVDPSMITVEITEDCGFVESEPMGLAIERLKDIGFRMSLDDFGCKYSNIKIISSISFDEVKIDKSLLSNNNSSKQIILEHLIKMFHEFSNVDIVVEGIENEEHLEALKFSKGLIGQGYLFARPLTIAAFWEFYNQSIS